ncbi:MAG: porin [Paraburkholderia sp.]|uniref:porin n=1 Tax=Paraburkholderia sp. TaxID=1926495 RepID=UPI001217AE7F|nr:porin [Paraburkholderia sp.]TAL93148.1 MAG: porin [Paraburkholderia sp.]
MKKSLVGLSILALAAGAHAQSSVTLYGRIDNGFTYWSGRADGHLVGMETAGFGESWWGITGAEDLGGGTKAIFKLESGLNTLNGGVNNGSFFGRHAYVGLTNDKFGTFKMGNLGAGEIQQDSWDIDPQLMEAYSISELVRGRNYPQAGNGLEYTSPTFGGLTLKGQYDLTNNPNGWNTAASSSGISGSGPNQLGGAQGRTDGIKAMYNAGDLELLAIYDETRDPNGRFSNVYVNSRSVLAGGTYVWGPFKAFVGYQHLSAPDASLAGYGVAAGTLPSGVSVPTAVDHEWLGLQYTASPFLNVTSGVYHANANKGNGNATMYTLGASYNLSKRTLLYTELAYLHNSSTSNIGLGNGYADPYGPNGNQGGSAGNIAPNYGHSQFGMVSGIMTTF